MARTPAQKRAGARLAKEEAALQQAIGEFIFWFSQLEFTLKARLAAALKLPDELFDIVIGPYDFAVLCTVTREALSLNKTPEVKKRITHYFNRCHSLNQKARLVVAHGSWTLGGARHTSRTSLKASFYFENPRDLRNQAETARRLMSDALELGA